MGLLGSRLGGAPFSALRSRVNKTRALIVLAAIGFGCWHGARDLASGMSPYSGDAHVWAFLVFEGATFLLAAALSYGGFLLSAKPLLACGLGVGAVYCLSSSGFLGGMGGAALGFVGQAAGGAFSALFMLVWIEVLTSYENRCSVFVMVAGYALSMLLQMMTNVVAPGSGTTVFPILLALSLLCALACLANNGYIASQMRSQEEPDTTIGEMASRIGRATVGVCALGCAFGLVLQHDVASGRLYAQTLESGCFNLAAALLIAVVAAVARPRFNIDYIVPVAAATFATLLLWRSFDGADAYLCGAAMTAFDMCFGVLVWLMIVPEAHMRKLPGIYLLGLVIGASRLSLLTGRVLSHLLSGVKGEGDVAVLSVAFWLVAFMMAVFALSYERYARRRSEGALRADAEEEPSCASIDALPDPTQIEGRMRVLRERFGLSEREAQIASEYCGGRSARRIAEAHVISEHTVKTHLKRVYQKMDIHSRQDLLDQVAECEGTQV
ncbi:helix-turn-helix transcriptional regulator [Rubneribacter sp.]